ncbi:MAG: hypothetical protein U0S50_10840 [Sphingopyxis sp.]|uniref:hypothetical protein n=1 Tax=Sphingopyxis sp. TaxID=1908224 RepID=UPI002ABC6933|nr:hypothetical protein [Sphingopyxis sp.]MDZ3832302.1 hypothetical protein [Sphingopyxis sp.]
MTLYPGRRPLADLLVEFADGIGDLTRGSTGPEGLRPVSLECRLPVESVVEFRNGELTLLSDLPATRMRTGFDRPVNRLSFTLAAEQAP